MARLNPKGFSAKYHDAETDLLYYGYRFYNPSLGRWLSRDPIEEAGGKNLYGFLHNGPEGFVDSHGLRGVPPWVAIPPWVIEQLYAKFLSWLADEEFVKIRWTEDVECDRCSRRYLLYAGDFYVEKRVELTARVGDWEVFSLKGYKPKSHTVIKRYGCCRKVRGVDVTPWKRSNDVCKCD